MTRYIVVLACVLFSSCQRTPQEIVLGGSTMGTTYTVKVVSPPATVDRAGLQAVVDEVLQQIDSQMSGYRPDSEISRFNSSRDTQWIAASPDLAKVVSTAREISELSSGALDITIAPLVNLWGMGPEGERPALPSAEEVAGVMGRVGYRKLDVRSEPPALRKHHPELTVDLNAIAPGYAVDLLASRLLRLDITNFMIDIGGEVRAHGRNAQGEHWRIAVEKPVDDEPAPYAIVSLDNRAVATSGEYRHYEVRDGQRVSHTIDPRTGRPVDHRLASVVVLRPTAIEADAWATVLNVLGESGGLALANEHGIAAMFIIDTGEGLEQRFTGGFDEAMVQVRAASGER